MHVDNEISVDPSRMFNIAFEPSLVLNNHQFFVSNGRPVRGSSTINGQVMLRGPKRSMMPGRNSGALALHGTEMTWYRASRRFIE